MDTSPVPVSAGLVREIAVRASADPRTVRRIIMGQRARGLVDDRIRRELQRRGIQPLEMGPDRQEARS
jgi:hypothetical protein